MSLIKSIKSLAFFDSLSEDELSKLLSISSINSYEKNYLLEYENRESNSLIFLIDGLAKAYKIDKNSNEIFLRYIHKSSLISEISDIDAESMLSYSNIELVEASTILKIDYKNFREMFLDRGLLYRELIREILKHSNELQMLVNREFIFDSVAKVSMLIASDVAMFNSMKRNDVALMLHIQPSTLSRVLKRLKRNSIIDIVQGRVTILDLQAIESIYKDCDEKD